MSHILVATPRSHLTPTLFPPSLQRSHLTPTFPSTTTFADVHLPFGSRSDQKMRSNASRPEAMASDDGWTPTRGMRTSSGPRMPIRSPAAKFKTASFHRDQSSQFKSSSLSSNDPRRPITIIPHILFATLLSYLLCYLAHHPTRLHLISRTTMVETRTKNKLSHPAAPVMTRAAKEKAGIKTQARRSRVTKDEKIRALEARLAAFENPQEESFSNEPLVRSLIRLCSFV